MECFSALLGCGRQISNPDILKDRHQIYQAREEANDSGKAVLPKTWSILEYHVPQNLGKGLNLSFLHLDCHNFQCLGNFLHGYERKHLYLIASMIGHERT